ncbi:MAG: hypothetical protein ACWGQW_22730, partial [bacterium]
SLAETRASLDEILALKDEVESLRNFKTEVEEERARAALVEQRKRKFSEAGIEMSDEEWEAASEKWLSLDDSAFDFVISQLVLQKPASEGHASVSGDEKPKTNDPKELMKEFLANRNKLDKPEDK